MYETFWIDKKFLNQLTQKLADDNPEKHANILKELAVAEIRAENTPVLSKKFIKMIGKNDQQVPLKITPEEKTIIEKFLENMQ